MVHRMLFNKRGSIFYLFGRERLSRGRRRRSRIKLSSREGDSQIVWSVIRMGFSFRKSTELKQGRRSNV